MTLFSLIAKFKIHLLVAIAIVIVAVLVTTFESIAPKDFPVNSIMTIEKDSSLTQVANMLEQEHIIKSAFIFKAYAVLIGARNHIVAGQYKLTKPESVLKIATRAKDGDFQLPKIKVTIPEGLNSSEITGIISKDIPGFNTSVFQPLAKRDEGHLFPDTYFFYPNVEPVEVISTMKGNFESKIASLSSQLSAFPHSIDDVVKMASIVELEATSTADREIIAGILWKRIATSMALSVDPPFHYFLGKSSADLTLKDLATDSPYNLYKHLGLPPTAIDSPGMDAILATLNPVKTNYFYYLSGRDGRMHYAATLAGHLVNKQKYLD